MVRKIVYILAAFMGIHAYAAAQDLKITGTVTDQTGYPLEGATVLVRGTTKGTTTDAEGRYMLNATQDAEIVVSYLGYLSQSKNESVRILLLSKKA